MKQDLSGNIGLGARTALLEELAELDAAKAKLAQKRGRAILDDAKTRIEADGCPMWTPACARGIWSRPFRNWKPMRISSWSANAARRQITPNCIWGRTLNGWRAALHARSWWASREFKPIQKVLIAFDGHAAAMKTVDYAARAPLFQGLEFVVISAGADSVEATRKLEGALALLRGAGHKAEGAIVPGPAEEAIAAQVEAHGADMVLTGAYRHSRIRGLLLGSTTSEIVRSCHVPVMLIR